MANTSTTVLAIMPLTAFTLHELVLRRVEVDNLTLPILAINSVVYAILIHYTGVLYATEVALALWLPLWTYIGAYRAFFHPLSSYPGPLGARISKWYAVKKVIETQWHWHRVQQDLQKQYGDYVRTGPRELSIFDPDAVQVLLGFQSKTSKGPFYDVMEKSLHLNRDKPWHRQRRKIWDNAMKTSLSDFAPRVEEMCDQLLARLRQADEKPVLLLETMTYFSYDTMSALAFGKPMGFTTGESSKIADSILNTFTQGLSAMGIMYHMPWLMNALGILTSLAGPLRDWTDWSISQMKARMALKDAPSDLIGELIKHTPDGDAGQALLYGESRLIISAGSETTSTALTFIFMQLATHPQYTDAIRAEHCANASTYHCARSLPLLDSVINESMRLWPSVFFASQRVTPPEGLTINGHFIPGNTIVQIPPFVLNRDARNFVDPDSFVPERWTSRPEMVMNKAAFLPFSTGSYSCAGKNLAWMELRSVVGRVVNEFDVRLPEEFVEETYWEGIREHFTAGPPRQEVRFIRVGE
ncbi:heme binding [Ascochyta rabiei]|uniref:Heme binding n=2 Tax=Didymella rabiei TaxID=5454 RepID=A0A163AGZ3_DIDRA|nr:heme binding [Ascochyta rabiei]